MDCIPLVLEKLSFRDIDASVNEYDITWLDSAETEYFIQLANIDGTEDKLAWFQSSERDENLLRVFDGDIAFDWKPITYNSFFGCFCNLLEWYNDHLIFVYKEKHDTYICTIRDGQVNTFNFNGDRMERKGDTLFFQDYENASKIVRRIRIPDLKELEPISETQAINQNMLPQIVIFSNGLKNK